MSSAGPACGPVGCPRAGVRSGEFPFESSVFTMCGLSRSCPPGLQTENHRQMSAELRHGRRLEPSGRISPESRPVDKARVIGQRGGIGIKPGFRGTEPQVKRVLRRGLRQRNDRRQRAPGLVVGIGGNDDNRPDQSLFLANDRLQTAPVDLTSFRSALFRSPPLVLKVGIGSAIPECDLSPLPG